MSQIYKRNELQQQIMFPNNNYYQPNYYIEDDYLSNIPYPNYYTQPNVHDHPKKLW